MEPSNHAPGGLLRGVRGTLSPRRLIPELCDEGSGDAVVNNVASPQHGSGSQAEPLRAVEESIDISMSGIPTDGRVSASASPWLGRTAEVTPQRPRVAAPLSMPTTTTVDTDSGATTFLSRIAGYDFASRVSQGVYIGKQQQTGADVCLKVRELSTTEADGVPYTVIREISILQTLNHPNVVHLFQQKRAGREMLYILEYLPYSLQAVIGLWNQEADSPASQAQHLAERKQYMKELLIGLKYLHSQGVMHRDIKPHKLRMLRPGSPLKITSFSISRHFHVPARTYTRQVVTLWYRPPEILLGLKEYSAAVDLWSAGCIFAELCNYRPLFQGDSEIDQLYRIFRFVGTPTSKSWPGVRKLPDYRMTFPTWKPVNVSEVINNSNPLSNDLLLKLLTCDPRQRINAHDALEHEFFV